MAGGLKQFISSIDFAGQRFYVAIRIRNGVRLSHLFDADWILLILMTVYTTSNMSNW